jgi:sirohydrochlorin ferrochelatase
MIHNWVGGMSLIQTPDGDYCRQKGAWVIAHACRGDLILTADSHSFVTFLEYQTPARVLDAKFRTPENVLQTLESRGSGRVLVYSDVINVLPALANRGAETVARLQALAGQLHSKLTPVFDTRGWVIYEWDHPLDK